MKQKLCMLVNNIILLNANVKTDYNGTIPRGKPQGPALPTVLKVSLADLISCSEACEKNNSNKNTVSNPDQWKIWLAENCFTCS